MKSYWQSTIAVVDSHIELIASGAGFMNSTVVPLSRLPEPFVKWQLEARRVLFSSHMATADRVRRFQAHLPVLVTRSADGAFPFHTANKGTGLLPTEEWLGFYTGQFKRLLKERDRETWGDTLRERIALMDSMYSAPERLELRCLGSLEIFQGQSFRNILRDPRVSLHYTGEGPDYPSFQVNAIAEVVGPGDARYDFLYWARQLFEHDSFHIQQPAYPSGYVFWVSEVFDKSPADGGGRRIA